MTVLPDHLKKDLDIVFIGYNPSIRSGELGHHYANPTNRFWKLLALSGLLPRPFKPLEDAKVLDYGYGLTNIVSKPTRAASDLTKADYKRGRVELLKKLKTYKPKVACYVGKGVYEELTQSRKIPWGRQPQSVLPLTIDYVVPSSSGLVRMPLTEMVEIYKGLRSVLSENQA